MKLLFLSLALAFVGAVVALPQHLLRVEVDLFSDSKQTTLAENLQDADLSLSSDLHALDDIDRCEREAIIKKGNYYIAGFDGKEQPVLLGIADKAESGDPLVTVQAKDAIPRLFSIWGCDDKFEGWIARYYGIFSNEGLLTVRFSGMSQDYWVKEVRTGYYTIESKAGEFWTVDADVPGRLYLAKAGAGLRYSQQFEFRKR